MADPAAVGFRALDPCVHCGFCLPACPTYLATGDENDSPRGRIVLMRALERGELSPRDPSVREHLDLCLGCRGCEPVCPSGVGYGRGLEAARERLADANRQSLVGRAVLAAFANRRLGRALFVTARILRDSGAADRLAGSGRLGFTMGMIAATGDARRLPRRNGTAGAQSDRTRSATVARGESVVLFRGCVMDVLSPHVHDATRRTLEAHGYTVVEPAEAGCCGAPHAHAGDLAGARELAVRAVRALTGPADWIVTDSAGCGAVLKDYGHLLGTDAAHTMAGRVRDVTELLARAGPRQGAPVPLTVAYDAPCHLQHAQRVSEEPLAVLRAIPALEVRMLPGADRCCGAAGIYGLLHPEMAGLVLEEKIEAIRSADPRPDVVATGNPGCIMQIGAGLRAARLDVPVVHPVELLDHSYAAAGFYASGP
jgi:glycolate oxidase iron-sulfur subunit